MRMRIRDLVNPGYGIRDVKKSDPGSGINTAYKYGTYLDTVDWRDLD
jgi:hypothetical protein